MKNLVRHPALAAVVVTLGLVGSMPTHAQTPDETIAELRARAEQGDAVAQYNLGVIYATGEGVPQDDAEAVRWYRLAAEQGYALAQGALGAMYMNGQGVPQDHETAHVWLNLAASRSTGEQRDEYVEARDAVAERMTREQLAEAQRRAREWDAASRLFLTNDSTRTTSENPSVDPPDFEYGDASELRGVKTVYVDTGFELKVRNDIVNNLRADATLEIVDRPQESRRGTGLQVGWKIRYDRQWLRNCREQAGLGF